jgi:carboxymethylenebutenolidase
VADEPLEAPTGQRAGTGYLIPPDGGPGPGLLLLHSWWGLTDRVRDLCDRFAALGFTTLAPDLLAGAQPETAAMAEVELGESDVNAMAGLVVSSTHALRSFTADPRRPIAVVGFGMGGSWALWLSARVPASISHVVTFYGAQDTDFAASQSRYQGHWADHDDLVSDDEVVALHALLRLHGRDVDFHRYPGTHHGFFEDTPDGALDVAASELAWARTVAFLADLHEPAG